MLRANVGWQPVLSYLRFLDGPLLLKLVRPLEIRLKRARGAPKEERIPIEVKYRRRIDALRDTLGLRAFLEKAHYNAPFGVLVTMTEDAGVADPRIAAVSLRALLLLR